VRFSLRAIQHKLRKYLNNKKKSALLALPLKSQMPRSADLALAITSAKQRHCTDQSEGYMKNANQERKGTANAGIFHETN
jgi:hypothetical protein